MYPNQQIKVRSDIFSNFDAVFVPNVIYNDNIIGAGRRI